MERSAIQDPRRHTERGEVVLGWFSGRPDCDCRGHDAGTKVADGPASVRNGVQIGDVMRVPGFLAVILSFAGSPAGAAEIAAESNIEAVTVFPSGAEIARALAAKLPPGDQTVVVDVTAQAVPASIRVEGAASSRLEIGSVDVRTVYVPDTDPAVSQSERKKIEDEIEQFRDRSSAEDDVISTATLQQTYLQFLSGLPQTQNGANASAQNRDWEALFGLLGQRMTDTSKAISEAKLRQRALGRSIADLEKRLPSASSKTEKRTQVRINVTAEAPLEASLILRYQVNGASWSPFYDARLATADEGGASPDLTAPKLTLARRAAVTQTTGEDWENVKLSLSTTRPGTAMTAPALDMLSADFEAPQAAPQQSNAPAPLAAQRGKAWPAAEVQTLRSGIFTALAAQETQAQVSISAFQAVYAVGGRTTIRSAAETRRLMIGADEADTSLYVMAVPRLDHTAYLYAKLALPKTSSPLLPGPVSLFRDGVFVGSGSLPQLSPGESHELGFGADERVRARQVVLTDKAGETGTFSKSHVEERGYAVTIKNLHARPMDIHVVDRMPVSAQEEIKVDFSVTAGPQPAAVEGENKRGLFRWDLKAAPDQEQKLVYGYRVTSPVDKKIHYRGLSAAEVDQMQIFRYGGGTKF
jgi:uncharacterized protein (TIGR02231 family)